MNGTNGISGNQIAMFLAVFAVLMAAGIFIDRQFRKPAEPAPDKSEILRADELKSLIQQNIRAALDSARKPMESRQVIEKHYYHTTAAKDEKAERDFRAGLVPCDTVITAKNKTIRAGVKLLSRCDSLRGLDAGSMASFKTELDGKNGTIGDLSAENETLRNKKPNPAVYITAGIDKVPEYWNPTIGAALTLPNGLMVKYDKGIIKDSHALGIGVKLRFGKN